MDKVQFDYQIIYFALVTLLSLAFALVAPFILKKQEEVRRKRIEKLKGFTAVSTDSPIHSQRKKAIANAVESVGGRFSIIKKISLVIIFIIWLLFVSFPFLGMIPATIISIVLSAGGVLIGITARPVIENAIAGIIITFSKLFRIGDVVYIDEAFGTIEDITITHSVIKMWDWRRYVIPNSRMMIKDIINYTLFDTFIWAYVEFYVSYEADLAKVETLAIRAAEDHIHEIEFEEPQFWVMGMEKDSILCWLAVWAKTPSDAWVLRSDLRVSLIRMLKAEGIAAHMGRVTFRNDGPSSGGPGRGGPGRGGSEEGTTAAPPLTGGRTRGPSTPQASSRE
jgi:moderate conductance mechanosensitive channel